MPSIDLKDFRTLPELRNWDQSAEEYLENTFERMYGIALEQTSTGSVVFDPASN